MVNKMKETKEKYKYGDRIFYYVVKPFILFLIYVLYPPKVKGLENIPKDGAIVLAGNHTKWLDPVLIYAVIKKRQVHFLAKQELFKGKTLFFVWAMGAIPVNRKIHDHGALDNAIEGLKRGLTIGIFPEGTINRTDGVIMPFKIGAVKMAKEANVPIVPFTITGEYNLFKGGAKIEFYKPITVDNDLDKTNEELMNIVKDNLIKGGRLHGSKPKRNKKNK